MLVRLEFGCEGEVGERPAHCAEQAFHGGACSRTRIADIEALALEVLELRHAGIWVRQHRERLRMNREDRPEVGMRAALLERLVALESVVLHIGLCHAEVELALLDRVHVERRSAGGFDRTADAVRLPVLVQKPADGAARGIVDAGDAAGADRHEFLPAAAPPEKNSAAERAAICAPRRVIRSCFIYFSHNASRATEAVPRFMPAAPRVQSDAQRSQRQFVLHAEGHVRACYDRCPLSSKGHTLQIGRSE